MPDADGGFGNAERAHRADAQAEAGAGVSGRVYGGRPVALGSGGAAAADAEYFAGSLKRGTLVLHTTLFSADVAHEERFLARWPFFCAPSVGAGSLRNDRRVLKTS